MLRILFLTLMLALPAAAQEGPAPSTGTGGLLDPLVIDRSATGGAQTLDDILARQEALRVDDAARREAAGTVGAAPAPGSVLGSRGGASDTDIWRGVRYDAAAVTTTNRGPAATVLIQDGGMTWLAIRNGPLKFWGGLLLGGTLAALALFYVLRGRIMIHGEKTGRTVLRFAGIERFAHWLLAGSFLALAITGLLVLFGRVAVIPLIGHEAWTPMAVASKWVHNNVAWAFMVSLPLVFALWVVHNIPRLEDLRWLMRAGGLFGGPHVPARKFNAGQKGIFWAVILGGLALSVTGVSLLFPFELPVFAAASGWLAGLGLPLPATLAPQVDMQVAQLLHAVGGIGLTAIIMAHIYLGSVGMEGAYDAMGSGEVEEAWALEHHSIWAEEAIAERDGQAAASEPRSAARGPAATPAE
jgi:formate dehydrogenase subunit gamma